MNTLTTYICLIILLLILICCTFVYFAGMKRELAWEYWANGKVINWLTGTRERHTSHPQYWYLPHHINYRDSIENVQNELIESNEFWDRNKKHTRIEFMNTAPSIFNFWNLFPNLFFKHKM